MNFDWDVACAIYNSKLFYMHSCIGFLDSIWASMFANSRDNLLPAPQSHFRDHACPFYSNLLKLAVLKTHIAVWQTWTWLWLLLWWL